MFLTRALPWAGMYSPFRAEEIPPFLVGRTFFYPKTYDRLLNKFSISIIVFIAVFVS
jgi:hypothetical protein